MDFKLIFAIAILADGNGYATALRPSTSFLPSSFIARGLTWGDNSVSWKYSDDSFNDARLYYYMILGIENDAEQ